MNTHFRPPGFPMTTQAAEGLARRRWTVAEVDELARLGILDEDERLELIEGELVPMSPKGNRHELLKVALNRFWTKRLREELDIAQETTFRISVDTYLEPDFVFYPAATTVANLRADNALLVVEIAATSLSYDLGRKAKLYAKFGIAELWVINADTLRTSVHRKPGLEGYAVVTLIEPQDTLHAPFAPELDVVLGSLKLA